MRDQIPGQTDIYHHLEGPAARTSDPTSSHEAAEQAARNAGGSKLKILQALARLRFANDEALAYATGIEKGPCARRRLDLQRQGLVQPVMVNDPQIGSYQYRIKTHAGVPALAWELSPDGRALLERRTHDA